MEELDELTFNGIEGETGTYLLPTMTTLEVAELSRRVHIDQLKDVTVDIDRDDLSEAGWGVIFPWNLDLKIKKALRPLLEHRRRLAGNRYRELVYEQGDTKLDILGRYGVGPGSVTGKVPYYLMIVGGPEAVPFGFQYQLDVQYAVGRLHFDDSKSYRNYAEAVVEAEKKGTPRPRRATFFSVRSPDDKATRLSNERLVKPLLTNLQRDAHGWEISGMLEAAATKERLGQLLGGSETPALLFTASHGLGFRCDHPLQKSRQGALVCAEWPGPEAWKGKQVPEDHYFAAGDVTAGADLHGLVTFHFACYGAGTPWLDAFSFRRPGKKPEVIASHPFVAQLPQRLLGSPDGGALAVIGHVERAWGWSYFWDQGVGSQSQTFEDTLRRLLLGWRVGAAVEPMNRRYAELSTDFAELLEAEMIEGASSLDTEEIVGVEGLADARTQVKGDRPPPRPRRRRSETEEALKRRGRLWTARNDARSYVVLGDPAVRLAVEGPPQRNGGCQHD